jgi:hypothetical protein
MFKMKNLMYLLVAGLFSVFAACESASTTEGEASDVAFDEVAEAAGSIVEGDACLPDQSCCASKAAAESNAREDQD